MSPRALRLELQSGTKLRLVDVREPFEWEICRIAGSVLIPLGDLPERVDEIDPDPGVVSVCHTGRRSLDAARFLRSRGIAGVRSLRGGVAGWAEEVEPDMARY